MHSTKDKNVIALIVIISKCMYVIFHYVIFYHSLQLIIMIRQRRSLIGIKVVKISKNMIPSLTIAANRDYSSLFSLLTHLFDGIFNVCLR